MAPTEPGAPRSPEQDQALGPEWDRLPAGHPLGNRALGLTTTPLIAGHSANHGEAVSVKR